MTPNKADVDKIIELEWGMFDEVNKGRARADCQDDYETFYWMRLAQFSEWPQNVVEAYLDDLTDALFSGRNLIAEKYIHMMQTSKPAEYESLRRTIPAPSETTVTLAGEITDALMEQTRVLFENYPHVLSQGRPLYRTSDSVYVTSVETYQYCELLTYSERTLTALRGYVLSEAGSTLARKTSENSVKYYGYNSLEAAENAAGGALYE